MYTFRFNPVFQQWVMLGGPVAAPTRIAAAHVLATGQGGLLAASYPRLPFLLDPVEGKKRHGKGLAYAEEQAVGEYELILLKGGKEFASWNKTSWSAWLQFVQERLVQAANNPYLHHASFALHTAALASVEGYQRLGDLIATSHPVCGLPAVLDVAVAEKIHAKEKIFTVWEGERGRLYVPSAPLQDKEVWFIPTPYDARFEKMAKPAREDLAAVLAVLFQGFAEAFADEAFVIRLHTSLAGNPEATWWLQIYRQDATAPGELQARALPENFVRQLHYLLAER